MFKLYNCYHVITIKIFEWKTMIIMDFKKKLNKLILSGLVLGMLSCSNVANAEMNVLDAMDSLISNPSISREYYYNDSMNMPNRQSLSSDDVYKEGMNLLLNRDYIEAFMTLKSAADMGNPVAAYQVAWMYNNGDGISSNPNKCFEYFQKSAYGGYPLGEHYYAIYLLGIDRPACITISEGQKLVEYIKNL